MVILTEKQKVKRKKLTISLGKRKLQKINPRSVKNSGTTSRKLTGTTSGNSAITCRKHGVGAIEALKLIFEGQLPSFIT